jgi:hypothetical protein
MLHAMLALEGTWNWEPATYIRQLAGLETEPRLSVLVAENPPATKRSSDAPGSIENVSALLAETAPPI